jgi:hypothetical protein
VAEHTDVRLFPIEPGSGLRAHSPAFIQDVTQRNPHAASAYKQPPRKSAGFKVIDVAGHRRDGSQPPETLNHAVAADITGVEDFIDAGKMPFDGGIIESVRIGDHPDSNDPAFAYRAAGSAADL